MTQAALALPSPAAKADVLEPGDYLVELETPSRFTIAVATLGMRQLGFARVFIDAPPRVERLSGLIRCVGRLPVPLAVRSTAALRWRSVRRLKIDLFKKPDKEGELFHLAPEHLYEVRFLSRPVKHKDLDLHGSAPDPERAFITDRLAKWRWETEILSVIRRDERVKERPDVEVTLWFGLLRWTGPESFVTGEEPFAFDDVVPVP